MSEIGGAVLVIGAGPAGLASAYYLERAGISYTVVDRADHIASTWSNLYPTLRLNTASFVTHLPGRRMPLRYGYYATGRQLYEYLRRYSDDHQFHIVLQVEVHRVAPENGGWRVETNRGVYHFDAVIVATGRFSNPYIPDIPGLQTTAINVLHARDYHHAEPFREQRVMVVGSGPSGVDIALELVEVAKLPVLLSVRSDIVIARRYPYGLPDTLWQMLARIFVPSRWRKAIVNKIVYQSYPDAHELGLKLAPNRTDRQGSSTPVRGRALIDAVKAGKIRPVAGIARLETDEAVLVDGSSYTIDSLILSTGYRPAIGYLDIDYETDVDGWPRRISDDIEGGLTQVLGYPGLYLVGRFYRGLGPLNNIRREAATAVREIEAYLKQKQAALPLNVYTEARVE
ncbi:MAG: NAD(P)/FAD-dependent oxidoreductase [Aggregatilineales bacterium]